MLAAMHLVKGTVTSSDLFTRTTACLDRFSNFLLKRMQVKKTEMNTEATLVFFHCITHQVLCKSVLKINFVVDDVTKMVSLIRARALNHNW